ncbi:MAG TPA: UDP-N-acetylmuramoyl-L-alanine--D-glutamate ligase [Candidatus Babeliales bacterium]|nr:UDP-N-acetylmuramoyl-L-alanine--D-glutamate ligase [Candidatus Babeliales bacterium]
MNLINKKIGIWGFGIVGKSVLSYLLQKQVLIEVFDAKPLSSEDQILLQKHHISFYTQPDLQVFLERNEYIIPSPGIDLRPYSAFQHKWIAELDLFAADYHQPIIAITGTIGKTSITHLLGQLLNAAKTKTAVGGNIGIGMLDLLNQESSCALLEVSSFQLELSKTFAPDLAIWTNFFPNHLDRHSNAQEYFDAKYQMIKHQQANQHALIPLALRDSVTVKKPASILSYFSMQPLCDIQLQPNERLYYYDEDTLYLLHDNRQTPLLSKHAIPDISYPENWLIICAALHLRNVSLEVITICVAQLSLPEHRLERIATINEVDFYNDSKSTTAQATLAAVHQLKAKPIHLLLGGLSKGVDRTDLIKQLAGTVYFVYCFGKEADQLHALCARYTIASVSCATLELALDACIQKMRPGDQILFSPAGASFDLFENYMHRGQYFKQLVRKIAV